MTPVAIKRIPHIILSLLIVLALCLVMLQETSGIKTALLIAIGVLLAVITLPSLLALKQPGIARIVIAISSALLLSGIHTYFN